MDTERAPMPDSGFDLHIDVGVGSRGERPSVELKTLRESIRQAAQHKGRQIGALTEKWIDVTGRGYDKPWLWCFGGNFK